VPRVCPPRMRRRAAGTTRFPYTTPFRSEGKREGASQASASLFTATLQPTKFGRAPSGIENQDMRLLWFKKRCATLVGDGCFFRRSEEHTSELQSHENLVCRPRLEKKTHE